MDKSKLETIRGTDINSIFYVVGEKSDLIIGLRVWVSGSSHRDSSTIIGFRVRVQMKQGVTLTDNEDGKEFMKFVNQHMPLVQWSGGFKRHVSMSGEVHLSAHPRNHDAVLEQYAICEIGNIIVQAMDDSFGGPVGVKWYLTPQEMEEFILETVVGDLVGRFKEEKHSDAVSINFCGINKEFIGGKEVTPVLDEGPTVADLVGLGSGSLPSKLAKSGSVVKGKITVPKVAKKHTSKAPQEADGGEDNPSPNPED